MTGLICRKIGMSSYFDEDGEKIPCTIVFSDKNTVLQIKNKEKDNYNSVLLGFGTVKKKMHLNHYLVFVKKQILIQKNITVK